MCVCAGVPVSSRVSAKIQQLVNTLKRPKRPPLREFFVDDFEELLEGKKHHTFYFENIFQTSLLVLFGLFLLVMNRWAEGKTMLPVKVTC